MTYRPTLYSPKRWAAADIDYVRQNYPNTTSRQMADELREPIKRVQALVYLLKKGGHAVSSLKQRKDDGVQIVSKAPTSALSEQLGISACPKAQNAPQALISAPADLRGFVQAQTVSEVARVLGMSRKTAWRLRNDHWPRDMRSVLAAWDAYKGRSTHQQSGWFLRKVHVGGVVMHVGRQWTSPGLPARAGQTLAVARVDVQTLLVQTLDLPSERFTLNIKA